MSRRFAVDAKSPKFDNLDDVTTVFHGVNKSGSLAMSKVIGEAMAHAGRSGEFFCHYIRSETYDEFRDLASGLTGRSFIVGHRLYGSLPAAPRRIWVTQFRHPLPRTLSVYGWLRKKHVQKNGSADGFPTIVDFVVKSRGVAHSQVKQFAGGYGEFHKSRLKRLEARDLYELSVDALEKDIYLIGIAEHFEESIFVFAAACGLNSVEPWQRDVRNKGRPEIEQLSDSEKATIEEIFEYDFRLYHVALERFRLQNQQISFGPSLSAYKDACQSQYGERIVETI